MRKLFLLTTLFVTATISSCKYDDGEIWDSFHGLENRVTRLEELCKQMNTNISSLQTIVKALQNNDYVTGVTPVTSNGETIGYTISFTKSSPITIYHGQNGKDGHTPIIGVRQDTDGIYYWTMDGEWLLDNSGNKIEAEGRDGQNGSDGKDGADGQPGAPGKNGKDGITPQLRIEEGYWYVSTDNGAIWTNLGKATGEDGKDGANGSDGDSMFRSVAQDDENVYFTLADGETITLPKKANYLFEIEGVAQEQFFEYGETRTYAVSQSGIVDCVVYCPNGWSSKVDGNVLTVKAPAEANIYADTQGQISVLASTTIGQCVIVKFEVRSAGAAIYIPDANFKAYLVENFDTDHDGEISIAETRQVTDISCSDREIATLEGIEHFENLTSLGCYSNKLTSLDISRNLKLKSLSCGDNPLESLEIANHPGLEDLRCDAAGFSTLKLSGLEKLDRLYCNGRYTSESGTIEVTKRGEIASVQLTDCPNLKFVILQMNKIQHLEIKNCDKIATLSLANNNLTGSIGFRNHPNLSSLVVNSNNIDKIILENCPKLKSMNFEACPYLGVVTADEYLTSVNLADTDDKYKYGEIIGKPGTVSSNIWLEATGLQELTVNGNTTRPLYIGSANIRTVTADNCIPSSFTWFSSQSDTDLILKDYSNAILDLRNEYDIIGYKSIDCTLSPAIEKIYVPEGFDGDLRCNENVTLVYGNNSESDL